MTDRHPAVPPAAQLRAMGIDSPAARDDRDLEESVQLLLTFGLRLEDLTKSDFYGLSTTHFLRPDANINPAALGPDVDMISGDFIKRLRVAAGLRLPEAGSELQRLTKEEVRTVAFFRELANIIGEDEVISLLRVIGSSASRIARAIISMLRLQFEAPLNDRSGRLVDILAGYVDLIEQALPRFLEANSTMVRSHLAVVVNEEQIWSVDKSRSATLEPKVVGFADLVGFTAFTEQASAEEFMTAIVGFEEDVQAAVVDNGGTLVKLIGDEVMFVAPDAVSALNIAQELSAVGRRSGDLKGMRVGLSSGEVINASGDYYGTVVNIAARIVSLAFTHAIVVTHAVAEDLAGHVVSESLGMHDLRGISTPRELFRLRP